MCGANTAVSRRSAKRGGDVLLRIEKTDADPKNNVLEVKNLAVSGKHGAAVNEVSFSVRAGEIVGIAGIEGNGQTELMEALSGLLKSSAGKVEFEGVRPKEVLPNKNTMSQWGTWLRGGVGW